MRIAIVTPNNVEERDMTTEEIEIKEQLDNADAEAKAIVQQNEQAKEDLKASAKAKLIAGEPLTEEEADTIVL